VIGKLFKDVLTGVDNQTFDHGRLMGLLSFIFYFILSLFDLLTSHTWRAMDFAGGIATMAVAFGVNLKLKSDTEPKKE